MKGLNLTVPPSQIIGFLGPNGAGKTTTIKMMCGLVMPDEGHVMINGYDVHKNRSMAMKQIGVVLEGTRNVYWRLSAWENLMYFARLKGVRGRDAAPKAEQLLRDLELWDRRQSPVRTFSRGMQQKVAIACALIADPPIVLLDEPTLGLDVQSSRMVIKWIKALVEEEGKTVVLTTHQLHIVEEICHHIAIIREGRLIANKPVDQLLAIAGDHHYQITVEGTHSEIAHSSLEGLKISTENGFTMLDGPIARKDQLYTIIDALRSMGLTLSEVRLVEADLEEVFIALLAAEEEAGA